VAIGTAEASDSPSSPAVDSVIEKLQRAHREQRIELIKLLSTLANRLFLFFSLAFVVFAADWIELALGAPSRETQHLRFLIRLVGVTLIIVAIVDKNRRGLKQK